MRVITNKGILHSARKVSRYAVIDCNLKSPANATIITSDKGLFDLPECIPCKDCFPDGK